LRMYDDILDEPALLDTGGARAAAGLRDLIRPTLPHIPSTAASSIRLVDLVRALVVDPLTVWAPGDQWGAVEALIKTLSAEDLSLLDLADTLSRADVTEQRLIRGAAACLGPACCLSSRVRELFVGDLNALKETCKAYDRHFFDVIDGADDKTSAAGDRVARDKGGDGTDKDTGVDGSRRKDDRNSGSYVKGVGGTESYERRGRGKPISRMKMSLDHLSHTYTPQQ